MNDQYQLVEQARQGDRDALGELIRLHRAQMMKWARIIVRNPVTAEDIVQDALVQTIRRLYTLKDPDKFVPWLRSIVRNCALMDLRRSGCELPCEEPDQEEASNQARFVEPHGLQEEVICREAIDVVERLLSRLGDREREVVKAHVLAGIPIAEVAQTLGVKSGAVYTALSRARHKLTEARFQTEIAEYAAARRRRRKPSEPVVTQARYHWFSGVHNTMASMMLETLLALDVRDFSMTDIMGLTGHAFRLHATPDSGLSSAIAFDWGESARFGWNNLGYAAATFGGAGEQLSHPDNLISAMERIHESLDRGIPVMAWNLSAAEFGLIRGYDDAREAWLVMDTTASGKWLPYHRLGRRDAEAEWFVAVPGTRYPMRRPESLCRIFQHAVRHIRGEETPQPGCANGIKAYNAWIQAFQEKAVSNPLSAAYNAACIAEARKYSVRFLQERLTDEQLHKDFPEAIPAISVAVQLYIDVFESWSKISRMFPLPYGGDPQAPGPSDRAARLLESAMGKERQGVDALEEAAYRISRKI